MSYIYPIGAARTATFETIAVIGHAAMAAVCMAAAGAFLFQSRIYIVYDVFHDSLSFIKLPHYYCCRVDIRGRNSINICASILFLLFSEIL
jgi:hypothetical protein